MRLARNGSVGTGANTAGSVVSAVVAINVVVVEGDAGIVGLSCAKLKIQVVARKTAERTILMRLYLF